MLIKPVKTLLATGSELQKTLESIDEYKYDVEVRPALSTVYKDDSVQEKMFQITQSEELLPIKQENQLSLKLKRELKTKKELPLGIWWKHLS